MDTISHQTNPDINNEGSPPDCPFCMNHFKRLGNHLPYCKDRQGRDYSMYLSKKTQQKSKKGGVRKTCTKCLKSFVRLDTHLKNSASCKYVPSLTSTLTEHQNPALNRPSSPRSEQDSHPQNISHSGNCVNQHLNQHPSHTFSSKASLLLPTTKEDWAKADEHFRDHLVPQILETTSVDEKNRLLVNGIYEYLALHCGHRTKGSSRNSKQQGQTRKKHDRALKRVTELKRKAKKDFRQAQQTGLPQENIHALAKNFFDLVRQQSKLKKTSRQQTQYTNTKKVRQQCHRQFWKFAKELLDDNQAANVKPQFTEDQAVEFFTSTYKSQPQVFEKPTWMPSPDPPTTPFDDSPISLTEIQATVKRSNSSSSPSSFDQITYRIFKRCPSLCRALLDLFQQCWCTSSVPDSWKHAAIKLIGKSPAIEHPDVPSNFRPIALTSCVGKLFTTILKNRWSNFMLENKYLDKVQKAFMTATPGCIEHQAKLATILHDAKSKHKSLAVCWLDLANAYGSVHHSLINFSLKCYHAPPVFHSIVQSLYKDLSASIITKDWSTPAISLEIGVYQGDPLSVVIFNTVINTLVDSLKCHTELGYTLTPGHRTSLLQYADDTCITANGPSSCQSLLDTTDKWLQWSGMRAKVSKCHSLAIKSSSGKMVDPQLEISGETIPFIGNKTIKFLGMKVGVPQTTTAAKRELNMKLENMLQAVDKTSLTRHQKLKLYKQAICPRLNWLLMIYEYPMSWIERQLNAMATRFVKKWSGLAKPANPNMLFLPQRYGGLDLPSLSTLYKKVQVSRQCQLLTSADATVRRIAEQGLQTESQLKRKKFRPAIHV